MMFVRYAGWFLFLIGVAVYAVLGQMTVRTAGGKLGAFIMIGGMLLSTAATILQHLGQYRKNQQRMAELRAQRELPKSDEPPPPSP